MLNTSRSVDADPINPATGAAFARPDIDGAVESRATVLLSERHGYQPPRSSRVIGGLGTAAIIPIVLLAAYVTLRETNLQKPTPALVTMTLKPVADAPAPKPARVEREKPKEQPVRPVQKPEVASVPPPIVPLPTMQQPAIVSPQPAVDPKPVDIAPPVPPQPASPPAPSQAHHGPDRWEGRVLARLESVRRYPPEAQRARQQGTTVLRFRLDRTGHVLSSSIERSSGNPALDQAALETLRRADPLPKIPADRPDQVELVVPIEFTISR